MPRQILNQTDFRNPAAGWCWPNTLSEDNGTGQSKQGGLQLGPGQRFTFDGYGVHTRNGDSIELHFVPLTPDRGELIFGFSGGFEEGLVKLKLGRGTASLHCSDWTRPQPAAKAPVKLQRGKRHVLRLEKTEGSGQRVKSASLTIQLDGQHLLDARNLNLLPEMGTKIVVSDTKLQLCKFVHRGVGSGIPEFLHVGGWQMPNVDDLQANLDSISRALKEASQAGIRLLVTPETSLTGLFPTHPCTTRRKPVDDAEQKLKRLIRNLPEAPYLVVGLPVWEQQPNHRRRSTRFNACRVYDPDGEPVFTGRKIHSCETNFWHGYQFNEFDIDGAPISMHICHDGRYPEMWTLPVMFGARLIIHPSNGGPPPPTTVDAFEATSAEATTTMHAFYLRVNGLGHSCLVSPRKVPRHIKLIAAPAECGRNNSEFPLTGPPLEGLFHAKIRLHDAFGYWPVRSYRASEEAAEAYLNLYRARGGRRVD